MAGEKWQGAIDDLKIKSLEQELDESKRLQKIYDQLYPGVRESWEKFLKELGNTTDPKTRKSLYSALVNNDYYKSVGRKLDLLENSLLLQKARKSQTFNRS